MREPRPTDVLEAVTHVTGVNPKKSNKLERRAVASRRLAVAALREICDLTYVDCAHELGYADHSTPLHHARGNVDMRLLKAVLQRVSDRLEEEEASEQLRRMEVSLWRH